MLIEQAAVKKVMTDPLKEQLSAYLDGELPRAELDLVLKQTARDAQLRATVSRYSLIGETLRDRRAVAAPADFAARVSAAIAAEPVLTSEPASRPRPMADWLRPAAGFAIAAGVAAVAVMVLQPVGQTPSTASIAQAPGTAESIPTEPSSYIVPSSTDSNSYVPAARLTNYVVAHSEYSTPLGRRSVLSGVLAEEEVQDADAPAASAPSTTDTPVDTTAQ